MAFTRKWLFQLAAVYHTLKTGWLGDFPGGPEVKNLLCNAGDTGSIPGQGTKILYAIGQLSPHTTTEISCSQINKNKY